MLGCSAVELEDRRFYAVLAYTGLTTSEAYGLTISDVRLDSARRVVKVQRSRDIKSGEDGDTKTRARVRDVPVHPNVLPLLRAM